MIEHQIDLDEKLSVAPHRQVSIFFPEPPEPYPNLSYLMSLTRTCRWRRLDQTLVDSTYRLEAAVRRLSPDMLSRFQIKIVLHDAKLDDRAATYLSTSS